MGGTERALLSSDVVTFTAPGWNSGELFRFLFCTWERRSKKSRDLLGAFVWWDSSSESVTRRWNLSCNLFSSCWSSSRPSMDLFSASALAETATTAKTKDDNANIQKRARSWMGDIQNHTLKTHTCAEITCRCVIERRHPCVQPTDSTF